MDLLLELLAGVKCHHPARLNWYGLAGSRVAPRAWRLGSYLKISKSGDLDIIPVDETG